MINPITYADLDRLLRRHRLEPRPVPPSHLAYVDQSGEPIFVFPVLPPSETVRPIHLAAVRRWFLDTGAIEDDEFERWLCCVRFGDECPEPAAVGAPGGRDRVQQSD
jgi:hypothetical protein